MWLVSCLAMMAQGCAGDPAETQEKPAQDAVAAGRLPPLWASELALSELPDLSAAADVVEVELDARAGRVELAPGKSVSAYTYAGSSPGPVIRARVGDTLRVHFTNNLPDPTTVHWHGLEVPASQDGAGHAGTEIAPGARFDYEFKLLHAGTYWYHPHVRSAEQVWRGLYGALIVEDPQDPPLGDELTLLLHDVELTSDGAELGPAAAQGDLGRFFGHEGATLLVNGRIQPTIQVYPGSTLRLRVINTSISRYYRLGVEGHKLVRVAGDSGLLARAEPVDDLLLVPGERSELMLTVKSAPSGELKLRSLPYDRFVCGGCSEAKDLMSIEVVEGVGGSVAAPSGTLSRIEPIDLAGASTRELVLSETMREGATALAINGLVHGHDGLVLQGKVGSTERWTVRNDTDYDHPFHLHGFRFQVLTRDGVAPAVLEWKDTVNVVAHGRVEFAVYFDDRPGMWMFHCHILDHADLGMMGMLHLD